MFVSPRENRKKKKEKIPINMGPGNGFVFWGQRLHFLGIVVNFFFEIDMS